MCYLPTGYSLVLASVLVDGVSRTKVEPSTSRGMLFGRVSYVRVMSSVSQGAVEAGQCAWVAG